MNDTAAVPQSRRPGRALLKLVGWFLLTLLLIAGFLLVYTWIFGPITDADLWAEPIATLTATLLASWFMLWREGRPFRDLGFGWSRDVPRDVGAGIGIGAAELGLVLVILLATGFVRYRPEAGDALSYVQTVTHDFALFAVAAAEEEVMFRGYPFLLLIAGFGRVPAVFIGSALFALAHAGNPNIGVLAYLNLFLAGVLFSVAMLRTWSLWYATALHMGWNWALATLADLPVSGLEFFDTPLYEPAVTGPGWFTGGDFGPEAGLVGTLSIGAAIAAVVWDTRNRQPAPRVA
jgi:membrane protease YdiL (CAAX protease family)